MFVDAVLLAMEEALRHPDIAGVVCELEGRLDLVTSRRLQLAAEGSQVLGFLIRRSRRFNDPVLAQPSAAVTRWRIGTVRSSAALPHAPDVLGLHRPLWRLELLRCRGGEGASWIVEGGDAQVVSLWLPFWPIDRLRQHDAALPADAPPVTRAHGAIRNVGNVMGLTDDVTGMLASQLWGLSDEGVQEKNAEELNLNDCQLRLMLQLAQDLIGFPHQLSARSVPVPRRW